MEMLKINNIEIENKIEQLNRLIAEYKDIQLNLFNQLKDACINWQDGNSLEFENKIYLEKTEASFVLRDLEEKVEILNLIHNRYLELGQNIKCNLENKNIIIYSIENCGNQIESILNEFQKIDPTLPYDVKEKIRRQKEKVISSKTTLAEVKKEVTKTYEKIENIEKEVEEKIRKIDAIKINSFDYNF